MKPEGDIVLITGSNGRIGTAVMRELRKTYANVVGFDTKAPPEPPEGCTRIPVDITSDQSVSEGLKVLLAHHGARVASVVHLAAYYDFIGKPDPRYDAVTVNGTRRLLQGLKAQFEVQQFVFSSTMLVHKPGEPGIFFTEDWPIGPTWAYPESKVRTEAVIAEERGDIPTVMLRFAGVYDDGCHSPPLSHQMQRIYERQLESHLYAGSTSHGTAYVHMNDVVDAIARTVNRRATLAAETVLLIGEPDALSYDELQHSFMRQIHDESYEAFSVPGPIAKIGAWVEDNVLGQKPFIKPWMIDRANDHYALDVSRAAEVLGWAPQHTLRKTIPKMVAALKADPLGFYKENGLEPAEWMLANAEATAPGAGAMSMDHSGHGAAANVDPAANPAKTGGATTYTCPMHPEIKRGEPGNCPICGMTLVAEGAKTAAMPAMKGQSKPDMAGGMKGHAMPGVPGMKADTGDISTGEMPDMMGDAHRAMLWPHYVAVMMGFWLIFSPFTLGYLSDFVPDANQLRVMAERGLSPFAHRAMLMTISDMASGVLVVAFGLLSADVRRRFPWAQWANAVVGGWLLLAPLVVWTPLPEAYANDTLVGLVVIALAVLIPMMAGMSMEGMMGKPDIPPEWGYGPATFVQRLPIGALALVGFLISRYMAAYQMGHVDAQWEPFFAGAGGLNGTETIITSDMSKAWPVADAGLGTVVYALEIVMTFMGGKDRWRTMPWMVLALALLILPLGIVSIYFVIVQPILVGTWCTLCLVTALAMALMIPFSLDEFVAMGQFLAKSQRAGKPFWRTFWMGGAMEGGSDDRAPGLMASPAKVFAQAARGVTVPWTLLASIAVGAWLTFTRMSFGNSGSMADSDHLVGLLVVTFSIIALAEVTRAARFLNVPAGLWLIAAPWLLDGAGSGLAQWAGVAAGLLIVGLALPRGSIRNSYGGWNVYVV